MMAIKAMLSMADVVMADNILCIYWDIPMMHMNIILCFSIYGKCKVREEDQFDGIVYSQHHIWWHSIMCKYAAQIPKLYQNICCMPLFFIYYRFTPFTVKILIWFCVCVCAARNQLAFMLVSVCCTHRYSHILSQKWFYNVRCVLCHILTRQAKCNVITRASVIITHSVTVREINGNWANEIYSEEVHTIYLMVH